ncbi:hypothetical protein C7212DRAFT_361219 [Tuber magnatum]|uniref:Uncharacterized protein n=1 Tax=Tuber magnatum TaxID=42249 RepID=A0A317T0Z2_9PEZI|nr:hypothetical protein C7212DRAFT_361219 [Tuber magnatum]
MENIEVHPWAAETTLFRPLPEIGVLGSRGNVLDTYRLELPFVRPFNRRDPEPASNVVDGLIVDSERYKFFPTHERLPATLEREIRRSFTEMGMEYPGWVRPPPSSGENEEPGIEDLRESLGPRTIRNRLRSNGNFRQEISITNYAVNCLIKHSFNQSVDLGPADEAFENPRKNVMVYARFLLLIQAHFDGTDPMLRQGIDGLVDGILGGSWYSSLPPEEQERMQNLRHWYMADRVTARDVTRTLREDVCTETLIIMLMHEISKFEAIDGRRRAALNLEVMRENYAAYTNESIYRTPEARSVIDRLQLDGVFQYEEPFWYKRLQVKIGPLLAEGNILAALDVEQQCGFRGVGDILHQLVREVEEFARLNELQIELSRLLMDVCEDAGIPTNYTGPRRNTAKHTIFNTLNAVLRTLGAAPPIILRAVSRAILFMGNALQGPSSWSSPKFPPAPPDAVVDDLPDVVEPPPATTWQLPTWCTYLLNDLTLYDQIHQTPPPSNPRRVDELNALISLLMSDPPITPNDQTQYTKWWSRRVRHQVVRMADEHIELFRLPDLDLINPTLQGAYSYPGDEFGMDLDALDMIRRENITQRGVALQRALDEENVDDSGSASGRERRRGLAWRGWSLDVSDYFRSVPARRWRDEFR